MEKSIIRVSSAVQRWSFLKPKTCKVVLFWFSLAWKKLAFAVLKYFRDGLQRNHALLVALLIVVYPAPPACWRAACRTGRTCSTSTCWRFVCVPSSVSRVWSGPCSCSCLWMVLLLLPTTGAPAPAYDWCSCFLHTPGQPYFPRHKIDDGQIVMVSSFSGHRVAPNPSTR